jgi:hypothetical protein
LPDTNVVADMETTMAVFSQIGGIARDIQQKKSPEKLRPISSLHLIKIK